MILDVLAMIFLSAISILFLVAMLMQRKAKLEMLNNYIQSEIEKAALVEKLSEILKENESKSIEESDGFLKFVSESRDWAFRYIEEVQSALREFDKEIGPSLAYAEKYGLLDINSPSKDSVFIINDAYKKLKRVLPEEI